MADADDLVKRLSGRFVRKAQKRGDFANAALIHQLAAIARTFFHASDAKIEGNQKTHICHAVRRGQDSVDIFPRFYAGVDLVPDEGPSGAAMGFDFLRERTYGVVVAVIVTLAVGHVVAGSILIDMGIRRKNWILPGKGGSPSTFPAARKADQHQGLGLRIADGLQGESHIYLLSMTKSRVLIILLAAVAGLVLAGLLAYVNKQANLPSSGLMAVTSDAFGGPFTLTDHNGKTVTEKEYAGRYRLFYFGFTFCPAICPTELSKITTALNSLGPKAQQVQTLFVTVDPERDTAEKMKNYVAMFHPSIIGLTGTPEQVAAMLKAYKIYAAKVQDPKLTEYTMDHSTFIYLIGPDDRLLHIFKMKDTADYMSEMIGRWIDEDASSTR